MSFFKKILFCCTFLVAMNGAAAAEMIINGFFEAAPPGNTILPGGSTAITGWRTINQGVEWSSAAAWPAPSKSYLDSKSVIDLAWYNSDGNPGGGIGQSFATVPGNRYTLKFAAATFVGSGRDGTGEIQVLIDNKPLQKITVTNSKGYFGPEDWAAFSMPFTATYSTTYLSFTNTQNATLHFALLSGVSVTPSGTCCTCGC
jgi:hypothetical protein